MRGALTEMEGELWLQTPSRFIMHRHSRSPSFSSSCRAAPRTRGARGESPGETRASKRSGMAFHKFEYLDVVVSLRPLIIRGVSREREKPIFPIHRAIRQLPQSRYTARVPPFGILYRASAGQRLRGQVGEIDYLCCFTTDCAESSGDTLEMPRNSRLARLRN